MKFEISGTDRATGKEAHLVLEADSHELAAEKAIRIGLLVTSISPVPQVPSDHPRLPITYLPEYGLLHVYALSLSVLGVLIAILGGAGGLLCFIEEGGRGLGILAGSLLIGLQMCVAGAMLFAYRDIARNSWYLRRMVPDESTGSEPEGT